jgi:Family of unknown function (DUF5678)
MPSIRHHSTLDIPAAAEKPSNSFEHEQAWIENHRDEYAGKWVALSGGTLIAAGDNARAVYQTARQAGYDSPLLVRIVGSDQPPFGGW